jgi:hypothetical protein
MKNDIIVPVVTDVAVAVVPREDPKEDLWDIYLINLRERPLENVLITSQGYGSIDGVDKTTTVLRYFHAEVPGRQAVKIEPIQPNLFAINNEYWVSFNENGQLLDKKFRFPAGSIRREALEQIPVIERPGIVKS